MKRILISAGILLLATASANAQYKKASFLNKSGRTYDLGGSLRFVSDVESTVPGIIYSYGRDKGKRLFHWYDLELLLPSTFSYNTVDVNDNTIPVTVNGKSKVGLAWRYNLGVYFLSPESESKIKPFGTAGINVLILGGTAKSYTTTPEFSDPKDYVAGSGFSFGGNAGIGAIYAINEKFGIKATGGYNYQKLITPSEDYGESYKMKDIFSSHPYLTVGIRFTIPED